ncbi:MAG: PepSY domain-containing protein [Fibrella sp.]|nr:PepSY domain-containing protein [Armatimonadota bacterium]
MKIGNRNVLLVAVLMIGIATAAFAIGAKKTNGGAAANGAALTGVRQQSPDVASQTSVGDGDGEVDDEKEEVDEAPVAAKITPDEAKVVALVAQPGTVTKVELENEDGKPVYGVDITAKGGTKFEVEVSGDTGKVIRSEADDDEAEQEGSEQERKTSANTKE